VVRAAARVCVRSAECDDRVGSWPLGSCWWLHARRVRWSRAWHGRARLDQANIGFLLQQVCGEAVPQCVWRHPLLDLGYLGCGMRLVQLEATEILGRCCIRRAAEKD